MNVNFPICFVGSSMISNIGGGNDIGGSSAATGNTITDWGGAAIASNFIAVPAATGFGIYLNRHTDYNVSYNTLISSTGISVPALRGIDSDYTTSLPPIAFTNTISNNVITLSSFSSSGTFEGIRTEKTAVGPAAAVTLNIMNNSIRDCTIRAGSSSALN